MDYYLKVNQDNIITDAITYHVEGYVKYVTENPLPAGINGGWWKFENGMPVEYPELKPVTGSIKISSDKQTIQADNTDFATITATFPDLGITEAYILVNSPPAEKVTVTNNQVQFEVTSADVGYIEIEVACNTNEGVMKNSIIIEAQGVV